MRTPLVAGNWKMNMTVEAARSLVYAMSASLRDIKGVEKVLCPPFTALQAVQALLEGSDIGLGAQNMHWEGKGAFTGEVSPAMVRELCLYVILGHSERRTLFGETDETVNRRVRAAEKADLTPIFCVGETLQEHEAQRTSEVVGRQIQFGLAGLQATFAPRIVVAYEPVWAIGTGKASSAQAA
ncbi:MAG: triose-phosphate isomerase, partial [Chloroflexota bacterium]